MSRESLARATNSENLEMEAGKVHDVDRLAAAAGGNTLGGLLLRVREARQVQWARRIVLILANRARDKYRLGRDVAERIALAALCEFLQPQCLECKGARQVVLKSTGEDAAKGRVPTFVCGGCGGTGVRRFTNDERRAAIGAYGTRIESAMADAHSHMTGALGAYASRAASRLK